MTATAMDHRVRLGPSVPGDRYGPGVWHRADGPGGDPLCGQPCPDWHDRAGHLHRGTWQHGYGQIECRRRACRE